MEFDQTKSGLEGQLVESGKKIEHLTAMVQGLTDSKKSSNGNDTLKRIEAKLDIMAESDSNGFIDLFLENLRVDLEEKQSVLNSKISSIEDLTYQVTKLLKDESTEKTLTNELQNLKSEIKGLSKEFNRIQETVNKINQVDEQIIKINDNEIIENNKFKTDLSEQISQIHKFLEQLYESGNTDVIKNNINEFNTKFTEFQSQIDTSKSSSLDVEINAMLSVLSILDKKVKAVSDNFEKVSSREDVDSIKNEIKELLEKFNQAEELFKDTSVIKDIANIKTEVNTANTKFFEIKKHIDSSVEQLKENITELLNKEQDSGVKDRLNELVNKVNEEFEHLGSKMNINNVKFVELQDHINSVASQIKLSVAELLSEKDIKDSANIKKELEELKTLVNDLFLKDDTGPVANNLSQVQSKVIQLEAIVRESFEPKLNKIQDEVCLFQDKFNISVSNQIRSVKDEITQLNEKILDLKEYFTFQTAGDKNYQSELAVITEKFNDIWTNASLTIDKLGDQISISENSTEKFQNTVNQFFETSEETNLINTNVLKKTTEITSNLNETRNDLQNQIGIISNTLNFESQKLQNKINEGNIEVINKLASSIEADFNFLRSDVIEFKDRQEKVLEDTLISQESVQNSLSNLHFSLSDSTDLIEKRINEVALNLDKLNNSSTNTLSTTEIVKESLVQIAGWVDNAERLLVETNDNVRDARKNNEIRKVLSELITLKESLSRSSSNLNNLSSKIENDISDTKNELKTSLNVIKKRQECDFDSINTNISGISQEISSISQSFTNFENKIKMDLKFLNHTLSEKTGLQNNEIFPVEKLDANLNHIKKDMIIELRRINDKFNKFETNLENINEKLNKLETKQTMNNDNKEIRQMLEFIMSQITTSSENTKGSGLLLKKIGSLEKRMGEFDGSLRKVVSFLEDE